MPTKSKLSGCIPLMPLPIEAARVLAVSFVILGFLGVVYTRSSSFKSKIIYLLFLAFILIGSAAFWYSLASVHTLTELDTYAQGKPVKVLVQTFSAPYAGGTFTYESGPYAMEKRGGITFYRLEGQTWAQLETDCQGCVFRDCVNGQITERANLPPKSCAQVSGEAYLWNQTVFVSETRECAGNAYSTYIEKPAGPGRYKAELCYAKAFNFDWDMPRCAPLQNVEPYCAEAHFTIK